ncbi:lipoprotein [Pantoea sp. 18069]|uniref:LPS translocon maturation chaperone LptM n=1 Tax=Pantoea sp. 18069 TaxID=2681415 RepID=UPI00135C45D4
MLRASQILVRTFALALSAASLGACGQRGPLYLPTAPEAAQRATLPETLRPQRGDATPAPVAPPPAAR